MTAIQQLAEHLTEALRDGTLVKLTLSKATKQAADLRNVYARAVELKSGLHLSCTYRYERRDEVKNYPTDAVKSWLESQLGTHFLNADLMTTRADYTFQINKRGDAQLSQKPATKSAAPQTTHNKDKQRPLAHPTAAGYLHALGIANAQGDILPAGQKKYKQINRYIELLESILTEAQLPEHAVIADMGSGKGYLTFALYDYLVSHGHPHVQVRGVELRPELVDFCNELSKKQQFAGLKFEQSDIANYQGEQPDMLIALHACDVATDLAIAKGVKAGAKAIVVAPCCQKQVRKDMSPPMPHLALLKHGIMLERQAEMLTDGIRALLLEAHGYRVKVMEFVGTEHTPKNLMIAAVKASPRPAALDEVADLKRTYGIKKHALEELL